VEQQLLRKVQLIESSILFDFDAFCKKHDLKYSLYAGTLLGAVRHGGFIPWDDDIDVCMDRNEYDRFLSLWRKENPTGYYLQGTDDPSYEKINHTKIRKDGTILASKEEFEAGGHNGIWLDVFAFDKVPLNKRLKRKVMFWAKMKLIYTRGYPYTKGSKFLEFISKLLLLCSRKTQLKKRNKYERKILKYKDMQSDYEYVCLSCPLDLKFTYPSTVLKNFTTLDFEGKPVSVDSEYDQKLKIKFGDYMCLPPESERVCKHTPEVIKID
jgi:lipopolysaccharide cholinephosphotransferase